MIKIITDSTSDYTMEEAEEKGLVILPLRVLFGEEEYLDRVNLSVDDFYNKLIFINFIRIVRSNIMPIPKNSNFISYPKYLVHFMRNIYYSKSKRISSTIICRISRNKH